ncbi:F-box only protein 8 [Clonorchis sinensis]|uniref:F-box only protein 8 n=1 Tax=Clonorchis sinensis TaxID=79923 RepID=A0A8T1MSB6_CLOSI|nr:F-box only protein 8 [Clonorchis sinensis]
MMGQFFSIGVENDAFNRKSAIKPTSRSTISDRRSRHRVHSAQKLRTCHRSSGSFVDLSLLPAELALHVLSNLNATDLCLASCVWHELCLDDLLWRGLCQQTWPFCSVYKRGLPQGCTYRQLYLRLDEARLTFNADAFEGMEYLFKNQLLEDNFEDLIAYLDTAPGLNLVQRCRFLQSRPHLLENLVGSKDFKKHFLPIALRRLFCEFPVPLAESDAMDFVSRLVSRFSIRYVECNPELGLTEDEVYLLCFSLIMLSVDLWCPHVKNKMSKREFIRNTRRVARNVTDDFLGHLYDNVYLIGHVVLGHLSGPPTRQQDIRNLL